MKNKETESFKRLMSLDRVTGPDDPIYSRGLSRSFVRTPTKSTDTSPRNAGGTSNSKSSSAPGKPLVIDPAIDAVRPINARFGESISQGQRPAQKRTDLRKAYLSAWYEFETDGCSYTLRVGEQNVAVAKLLKNHGVAGAAFITAYNPASLQLGAVHNTLAERALKSDLEGITKLVFPGQGKDPDDAWLPEPSLLVMGLDKSQAETLSRRYGQYAILWVDAAGQVSLIELVDLDKANRYPLKVPPFGWVELGFNWGYEWANLHLTPSQWRRILQGDDFCKTSRAAYDGEAFKLSWSFSKGTHLEVSYGDGGTAYKGKLTGVSMTLVARQ